MRFMYQVSCLTFGIVLASVIGICGSVSANEGSGHSKLDKKDVPAVVMSAFEKAYPGVTIKEIEKSDKSGAVAYEIEYLKGSAKFGVKYGADGAIIESKELSGTLPEAVKKAIIAKYPKGKITESEKVTKGALMEYEVSITNGRENTELSVDETGKIITEKADDKDKDEGENGEKDDDNGKEDKE